jgi:hypothetical protein
MRLGRLIAAPVRILNAPFRAIEIGVAVACGDSPGHADYRVLSLAGEAVAKGIEHAVDEITERAP